MEAFEFKQFIVHQDQCAMKVGTDGVLLGAWTSLGKKPNAILDIGAGTGLIALQMAQRCDAELIDAIELDENAHTQCVRNFEASPWMDRLFCYHVGLNEFAQEIEEKYDLIVSNPPFYSEEISSGNLSRDKARQNSSLPFAELLEGVSKLLCENGIFSVIIPFKEETDFIALAKNYSLFVTRITRVKGNPKAILKRSLMEFGFLEEVLETNELIIELERHQYTEEYIQLIKDFYLKM